MSNLVKYKPEDLKVLYDIELELEVESASGNHQANTELEQETAETADKPQPQVVDEHVDNGLHMLSVLQKILKLMSPGVMVKPVNHMILKDGSK